METYIENTEKTGKRSRSKSRAELEAQFEYQRHCAERRCNDHSERKYNQAVGSTVPLEIEDDMVCST